MPSQPDDAGRFLHDFSFAGYHRGEQRPPWGQGTPLVTVDARWGDGGIDATAAIRAAIQSACAADGGVVFLPAGTYRVRLNGQNAALVIPCSALVLRGVSAQASRLLFDDAANARGKSVIELGAQAGFSTPAVGPLTADALIGQRTVQVGTTAGVAVGSWVELRTAVTPAFRARYRMNASQNGSTGDGGSAGQDFWPTSSFPRIASQRRVVAVTPTSVTLDAPLHFSFLTSDNAQLVRVVGAIEESGIENLGIGMIQGAAPPLTNEAADDGDFEIPGTDGYAVHDSRAITVDEAHDVWVWRVSSYAPSANAGSGVEVLSHGLQLSRNSFRTRIEEVRFGRPQYRGGGGNGYLFHLQGNDHLLVDNRAEQARHGLTTNQSVSGNVFERTVLINSRLADDTHRYLAHANLWDRTVLDSAWLQSVNRGSTSSGAGFTATSNVYWNTRVRLNHPSARGCAVESAQFGWGYVIGFQADAGQSTRVCTNTVTNSGWALLDQGAPLDWVEGVDAGASLSPPSLHAAQLARRCALEGLRCDVP